ncbi:MULTISPECIES: class I SAM-dependent methyltransferase [Actinomyces]|uniref:Class I SAM-dependent methyltransferase n=1 Tax=Actinomyces respiraculi TaxID=2744574 RepID=A0A7T0LKU8_9ACTO|nr:MULTISPECIES: class I SAM-dependent methyltransferase [Actinomyces]QPL05477.1 class I SAM-dependent methyltransferase [Actinomyces respiraculi]
MSSQWQNRWEERYASVGQLWSGEPNDLLMGLAEGWQPGHSLDLGCGEGDDVLWLASRGWQVVGVDVSPTAIARLRSRSAERGLTGVEGVVVDLSSEPLPVGPFDLVTSFFMHGGPSEGSIVLEDVLVQAAERVVEGGRLLAAVHCSNPPWRRHHVRSFRPEALAAEVLALLPEGAWEVESCAEQWRDVTGPDGQAGRRSDGIVCWRRLA